VALDFCLRQGAVVDCNAVDATRPDRNSDRARAPAGFHPAGGAVEVLNFNQ